MDTTARSARGANGLSGEAPADMVTPLLVVAAGLVLIGLFTGAIVEHFIQHVIPPGMG